MTGMPRFVHPVELGGNYAKLLNRAQSLRGLATHHEHQAADLMATAANLRAEADALEAEARQHAPMYLRDLQPGDRVRGHWTVRQVRRGRSDGRYYVTGTADDGTPFSLSGSAQLPVQATRPTEVTEP